MKRGFSPPSLKLQWEAAQDRDSGGTGGHRGSVTGGTVPGAGSAPALQSSCGWKRAGSAQSRGRAPRGGEGLAEPGAAPGEDTGLGGSCSSSGGLIPSLPQHLNPAGAHTRAPGGNYNPFFCSITSFPVSFSTAAPSLISHRQGRAGGTLDPWVLLACSGVDFFPLIKPGLWPGKESLVLCTAAPHHHKASRFFFHKSLVY